MEMKKNLRSVKLQENGKYEYLRVDVEEADKLAETEKYVYISKEEFKRRSKAYSVNINEGQLINVIDKDENKSQKLVKNINYQKQFNKNNATPNSSKLGKGTEKVGKVRRKGKYTAKVKKTFEEKYLPKSVEMKVLTKKMSKKEAWEKFSKNRYTTEQI